MLAPYIIVHLYHKRFFVLECLTFSYAADARPKVMRKLCRFCPAPFAFLLRRCASKPVTGGAKGTMFV